MATTEPTLIRAPDPAPLVVSACIIAANGALLLVLSGFALLKETPRFWLNVGGWPIWLRDMVRYTFYPLLGLQVLDLLLLTFIVIAARSLRRVRRPLWVMTALFWTWMLSIFSVLMANNLTNVLAGRPFHWHAPGM